MTPLSFPAKVSPVPDLEERVEEELQRNPRPREADEARHPWLTILLDTYYILTTGTTLALKDEEIRRGQTIGCGPGCTGCCLRPEVPVTLLEVLGIWWYVMEKLPPEVSARLKQRLINRKASLQCPFLEEGRCVVYPLRPLACRFLHVFGSPCKPEEIPVQDRPQDVWLPREAVPRAIFTMLEYFGFNTVEERLKALEEGYVATVSSAMSEFPWENLARAEKRK